MAISRWALAIVLLTAATYAGIQRFDFVNYDDLEFVVDNPPVAAGLTPASIRWAFAHPYDATGGPVTWLSHMLDVEMFGMNAGPHHVTNLVLHTINALLLLVVLARLTGAPGRSAFVAALFAVHPLHVESVAWISERKDVLSTCFWLLTIAAYHFYARRRSVARYALVVVAFVLGLLSKPMVATLPFVLLLLDDWALGAFEHTARPRTPAWRLVGEKLPLVVLSAGCLWLTLAAQRKSGAVAPIGAIPIGLRLSNALLSCWAYLGKTVWPVSLSPFYPYRASVSPVTAALCAVTLLCVSIVAMALRRRARYAPTGWFWYLGTLVPVIGLVQVGGHAMADRFTYVPLIGVFIIVSWAGASALAAIGASRRGQSVVATVIVLALAAVARTQVSHWQNGVTLWRHATDVDPGNARAHANFGVALARTGMRRDAIVQYQQALAVRADDATTQNNLGLALFDEGRHGEALPHYREAVRLAPGYANAQVNLANLLDEEGLTAEAVRHYRAALTLEPGNVLARANLAIALGKSGRLDEAIPEMLDAIRRSPADARWHYIVGMMWLQKGNTAAAVTQLRDALRLNPGFEDARRALAAIE